MGTGSKKHNASWLTAAAFLFAALLMTALEFIKQLLLGDSLSLWTSHFITIFVSAAIAAIACRLVIEYIAARNSIAREHEERYRLLFENSSDGIFIQDASGKFIDCNENGARLYGLSKDELSGRAATDFFPQRQSDGSLSAQVMHEKMSAAANGQPQRFDFRMLRADDTHFDAELILNQIDFHQTPALQLVIRDISVRKQAEALLRRNQILMQNCIDGIHVMDMQGNIVDANEAFCRMLGYSYQEMSRLNVAQWDAKWSVAELRQRCKEHSVCDSRFETVHRRKDGTLIDVEVSTSAMEVEGQYLIFASSCDISLRKQAEQKLLAVNNQLQHEVDSRTADLSALTAHLQNIAETERANIACELHDELGNTLVGLNMEVSHMRGKISQPDLLQDLSLITDLVANAMKTTRVVINQLYPTILDNEGFVAAVECLVNNYRKYSAIAVELRLPPHIPMEHPVALAAYRITQECLTNIAKHAQASEVHIEGRIVNSELLLTVDDNGKGFSDRGNSGGHGIFGMIERARYLGGALEIDSKEGQGTTSRLRLPLAKPYHRDDVAQESRSASASAPE